jgi:type VI secretion system protein VasG
VVIPYYPLSDETLTAIIRLQLDRIRIRIAENHRVGFSYDDSVVDLISSRCREVESGARVVDAILTNTLLPRISREFLSRLSEGNPLSDVKLSVKDGDFSYEF